MEGRGLVPEICYLLSTYDACVHAYVGQGRAWLGEFVFLGGVQYVYLPGREEI